MQFCFPISHLSHIYKRNFHFSLRFLLTMQVLLKQQCEQTYVKVYEKSVYLLLRVKVW